MQFWALLTTNQDREIIIVARITLQNDQIGRSANQYITLVYGVHLADSVTIFAAFGDLFVRLP